MGNSLTGHSLPERVKRYCAANRLIEQGDRIVAGVSGGADSMCLLLVLCSMKQEYGLTIHVVHVNHCIRGNSADEDEAYVKNFCESRDIPFHVVREDAIELARTKKYSVEEAGREIRYRTFDRICRELGADKIAVAHNIQDQAETMLFRMFRGTGLKGLKVMQPVSGNIIRPLLGITRSEIETFLNGEQVVFRQDETNFEDEYSRNCIRKHILPVATESINPASVQHLYELAQQCTEAADFIETTVKEACETAVRIRDDIYYIDIAKLGLLHPYIRGELILHVITLAAGRKKDITGKHVEAVLQLCKNNSGKRVNLPYMLTAVRNFGEILVKKSCERENVNSTGQAEPPDREACNIELSEIYENKIIELKEINMMLKLSIIEYKKNTPIPKNRCTKWFDYDKIRDTIQIRHRMEGDYLKIAQGKKSLKKYFIDDRIPLEERDRVPLLADGAHILWVCGHRTTEGCKVEDSTQRVLVAELIKYES